MIPRLNVALVYNMKPESADEGTGDEAKRVLTANTATGTALQPATTKDDTYAEWDSEETILAVKSALEHNQRVTLIEANEDAFQKLLHLDPDIVFNIAEGLRGPSREAQIPAMLEMLGIPYTGSDPLTLGICLDKARAKEILSYHHVPTASFAVVHAMHELTSCSVPFPAIVKPLHEGSSKGVLNSSVVNSTSELRVQIERVLTTYHEPALVERYLPGREFTVALLGNDGAVRVLPIIEIHFDKLPGGANPIYSFEAKWVWDTLENPLGDMYSCPARIEKSLEHSIIDTSKRAFQVLKCRDWCRIDIRLDDKGIPNIIELNPLPGILPNPDDHSAFPMAARAAGMDYRTMMNAVLIEAIKRHGLDSEQN